MKKVLGVLMALMVALTGFAFADTLQSVEVTEGYMLIRFCTLQGDSLALIGAGDGETAMNIFGSDDPTYAERFEDFWKNMGLLEPIKTFDADVSAMRFENSLDGGMTVVSVNGAAIARLKGSESFAILSGTASPAIAEGADVNVWTENSRPASILGDGGKICARCGRVDDGGSQHDAVISQFCSEGHTECMGDPEHHCEACGRDYPCSKSNSHTTCAKCRKPWCDKSEGDHAELACGHRGCEAYGCEDDHGKCFICGEFLCNGKDHTVAACGEHHASEPMDHSECGFCGGSLCDGQDHDHAVTPEAPEAGEGEPETPEQAA